MSLSGDSGCAPRLVCHTFLLCHGNGAVAASPRRAGPTSSRGPGRGTGRGLSLMRCPWVSGRPRRLLLTVASSSIQTSTVRSPFRGPGVHCRAPSHRPGTRDPLPWTPGRSRRERPALCCFVSRRGFLAARALAGATAGRVPSRGQALGFRQLRPACPVQPVPPTLGGPGGLSGEGPGATACGKVQVLGRARQPELASGALPQPGAPVLAPWSPRWGAWRSGVGGPWQVGRRRQCSDPQDLPWVPPAPGARGLEGGLEGGLGTRGRHLLALTPGRPSP